MGDYLGLSTIKNKLKSKKLYLIDLDGVMYIENKLISGAKDFIDKLKLLNKKFYFISNNSSYGKYFYVNKLKHMGINVNKREILLAIDGVISFLKQKKIRNIFIVGTESMKKDFFIK